LFLAPAQNLWQTDLAAHEMDKASIAQLRAKTIEALTDAGIPRNPPNYVGPGKLGRVFCSSPRPVQ
jgi:hypothetical protein